MIPLLNQLLERAQPNGGFLVRHNGTERPDSTAWAAAILGLSKSSHSPIVEQSRNYLMTYQLEDGRVSISPDHPDVFWPTSLAILAWQSSHSYRSNHSQAVQFLLGSSGKHWKKKPKSALSHDPSLKGWSWIDHTHSWVETTALAMIALHNAGYDNHPRLEEATDMLLDRQLPHGGWNYGNTMVFGQELRPSPEDTGAALAALAGRVSENQVANSLTYLIDEAPRLRTPIALGWSLLGLNAWDKTPSQADQWIEETVTRGTRFGGYDTPSLCLILAPTVAPYGLKEFPSEPNSLSTADEKRMEVG